MPFGIFHPIRLKQFELKPQGQKSALRLSLDVFWIHPASIFFVYFLPFQIFKRTNIVWHILETYLKIRLKKKGWGRKKSKQPKHFTGRCIRRLTKVLTESDARHSLPLDSPDSIKLLGYIHKVMLCSFLHKTDEGRPLADSNTECLRQLS